MSGIKSPAPRAASAGKSIPGSATWSRTVHVRRKSASVKSRADRFPATPPSDTDKRVVEFCAVSVARGRHHVGGAEGQTSVSHHG